MPIAVIVGASVFAALCLYPLFLPELLCYQLSSYRVCELVPALRRKRKLRYVVIAAVSLASMLAMLLPALFDCSPYYPLFALLPLPLGAAATVLRFTATTKIKLRFTPRLLRFSAVYLVFSLGFTVALAFLSDHILSALPFVPLSPVLAHPSAFLLAHALTDRIEGARNRRFIRRAAAILAERPALKRIGITGSAGKTTAKNILTAFLSVRYRVLSTEGNYNTPMGIALTVHRRLNDNHQVLIAEMGARYPNDIRELTALVQPDYGLFTNIGTQHLETFGSQEAIVEGKYALAEGLRAGGTAVFNGDDAHCRRLFGTHAGEKILYGTGGDAAVRCGEAAFGVDGTTFTLTAGSETVTVTTPLLGAHIPSVIAGCAAVAVQFGITLPEIAAAARTLKPVAHRLQLLYNGQDIVIDDAYNANEQGAASALQVLKAFTGRLRVVVTPGIVELGERQREANLVLGQTAAASADVLIVLGPNAAALAAGAALGGMTDAQIMTVQSLNEAVEVLKTLPSPKAVLFENDLPDTY